MLVQTDTRRRISLPPNAGIKPGDALNLEILEDGRIVLVPEQSLDLPDLWAHRGLNFEKQHGMIEPVTGEQLFSLRVISSARAITCLGKGPTLVLVSLDLDVAKAEEASDPRRPGRSCIRTPRALENEGDEASHGFPEG